MEGSNSSHDKLSRYNSAILCYLLQRITLHRENNFSFMVLMQCITRMFNNSSSLLLLWVVQNPYLEPALPVHKQAHVQGEGGGGSGLPAHSDFKIFKSFLSVFDPKYPPHLKNLRPSPIPGEKKSHSWRKESPMCWVSSHPLTTAISTVLISLIADTPDI